ncbi:arrestin family protein [Aspergillus stella-maris]|uniref:arrestin family protein n=1 Tax=Aspergillus stella-maris TaxID=1810926 RepID=UPI003CCDC8E7
MTAAHVPQDLLPGSVTATNVQFAYDTPQPVPLLTGVLPTRRHRRTGSSTAVETEFPGSQQQFPKQTAGLVGRGSIFRKLAGPRENAKRFLRLGTVQSPAPPQAHATHATIPPAIPRPHAQARPMSRGARPRRHRPVSEIILSPDDANMLAAPSFQPGRMRSHSSSNSPSGVVSRGPSPGCIPDNAPFPALPNEKTVATGSGISVGIALTEPVLFLQGYDQNDPSSKKSAILRGQLHLKVSKSVKIKKISICFRGQAQTDWPDGIPPKKIHFHDKKDLVTHGVVYFNHGDTALMQNDYGAHIYKHAKPLSLFTGKDSTTTVTREIPSNSGSQTSLANSGFTAKEAKRLSLQSSNSRSFNKNDTPPGPPQPQRNYRLFPVGDYLYSFEFPIDGSLPETIKTELGFVRYDLEAIVERSGAFRPNLLGNLEVPVIRTPAEGSLEQVEPIAISRNWEDQLHYDIVISGKSFPLGSHIPIAFKLTPLAKVECHRIKVYVSENIQHWTADKSVHRFQPAKKVLLFEKRADQASTSTYPGSSMRVMAGGGIDWDQRAAAARGEEIVERGRTNLLGNLNSESGVGPTEMEFNVQLPSCHEMKNRDESQRLHFDTTYDNIQINHWIKIVLRLSKQDEREPGKRRHFEISIDSPFHLLSCKATQGNIYLPAYTSSDSEPATPAPDFECGCAGAPVRRNPSRTPSGSDRDEQPAAVTRSFTSGSGGLARPPAAHIAHEPDGRAGTDRNAPRPMHLLRAPSFAPPAFDDVPPPPPLMTPPPEYTSIVGDNDREAVLEDYFSRLTTYEERVDDERGSGRVDVPLTPGARVNRSMDVPREWVRLDESIV